MTRHLQRWRAYRSVEQVRIFRDYVNDHPVFGISDGVVGLTRPPKLTASCNKWRNLPMIGVDSAAALSSATGARRRMSHLGSCVHSGLKEPRTEEDKPWIS